MNKEEVIKQIVILIIVIIGSIMLVRYFTGGETLLDYANNNNIPIHSEETDQNNK